MQIIVKPHESIKPLIREWRRSLSGDPGRRRGLSELYWSELVRRITEAHGPPPGSVLDDTTQPATYWCELTGSTWVQMVALPDRRTGLFGIEREVVVINLAPHPRVPGR
jgi:hypothetical protein